MRTIRTLCAFAVAVWLWSCASQSIPTETSIEQGEAKLLPDTVDIGSNKASAITAFVLIKGERKPIAVLPSDCNDGVGAIRVIDDTGKRGIRQVSAFSRGDTPADQLFLALCEVRQQKLLDKAHNAP